MLASTTSATSVTKSSRKVYARNTTTSHFFCLRGNHEQRPELCNIPVVEVDTEQVHGLFYHEDKYPNIYYFVDGTISYFDNFRCYAMGGAYSVDKYYRPCNGPQVVPTRANHHRRSKRYETLLRSPRRVCGLHIHSHFHSLGSHSTFSWKDLTKAQ